MAGRGETVRRSLGAATPRWGGGASPSSPRPGRKYSFAPPVTLRQKAYALFDPSMPASSPMMAQAATIMSLCIFLLIFLSIVVFCVESHPAYFKRNNEALVAIETVCVGVFTLELTVKLVTTEDKRSFCKSPLNWIDFISIIPFYIDVIVDGITNGRTEGIGSSLVFLRVIRLARVFRIFKLGKYYTGIQLVIYAMRRSSEALTLLGFLLGICLVLFAALIWICEQLESHFRCDDGTKTCQWEYNSVRLSTGEIKVSDFQSIPGSMWWSLVTLVTVGYGDQIPRTVAGKAVGVVAMTVGVLVLAFPIILISNNFSDAVKEYNQNQMEHKQALERYQEQEGLDKELEDIGVSVLRECTEVLEHAERSAAAHRERERPGANPAQQLHPLRHAAAAEAAAFLRAAPAYADAAARYPALADRVAQAEEFVAGDGVGVWVTAEWAARQWAPGAPEHWRLQQYVAQLHADGVLPGSPLSDTSPALHRPAAAEEHALSPPAALPRASGPPDDRAPGAAPAGAPPEPGPRAVVAYFRYAGRIRPVCYVARVGSDIHQFRYDPLFVGPAEDADGGPAESVDEAIREYVLHFDIVLDCDEAQDAALAAVRRTGLFDDRHVQKVNTFALPLAKITLSIPLLHHSIRLLTREFASPGSTLDVSLAADSKRDLDALKARLPEYFVQCSCATTFGSRAGPSGGTDVEVTVPLLLSPAVQSGSYTIALSSGATDAEGNGSLQARSQLPSREVSKETYGTQGSGH